MALAIRCVHCNCKLIYNPIRNPTDNNWHSGLFTITSRDDFRSIYFIEKEISFRHPQNWQEKNKETNRLETNSFCFIWHKNDDDGDVHKISLSLSLLVLAVVVVCGSAASYKCAQLELMPTTHSLRHRTNRRSSNNTNHIRDMQEKRSEVFYSVCAHYGGVLCCECACPKPNSYIFTSYTIYFSTLVWFRCRSQSYSVHEFPFKPKIYLVFPYAVSMNIQTMLIQLWCSNVRTVKRYLTKYGYRQRGEKGAK